MKHPRKHIPLSERVRWFIVGTVIFAILCGVFAFFEMRSYYQRRENLVYLAENQVRLMDSSLSEAVARAYTLRLLVETNGGSTDFFDEVADAIYLETKEETGIQVRNFILAPDGIVEKIYPLEGNESLVGFDYMDETQTGNQEALEAYEENKLILTEPFSLKQGGTGVAARLPVYLNTDDGEQFWGLVAVTLDMDDLLTQFNLEYLDESGVNYCLWYESTEGSKVILSGSEETMEDPVSVTMTADNLVWILEAEPQSGWLPATGVVAGVLIILVVSILLTRLLASQARIREMNAALEQIALRDNLTGCYSRHFVNVMLLAPNSRDWKAKDARYSLAVIDVDNFKRINDTYGHDAGDRALTAIANVLFGLCDELRGDCVIRYGGDEFIFLMNNAKKELFENRLKAILVCVREIRLEEAPDLRLTVSIGAVADNGKHTYYELFTRADKQIYLSKENGKNQYHFETVE